MPTADTNEVVAMEEVDDIEAYIATFDEDERRELAAAEAAIGIAILLHRTRERRGLSQVAAAELAGLHQQAVSRFEHPGANPHLETVQAYLGALGYALELKAIDVETGEVAAEVILPPVALEKPRRRAMGPRRRPESHPSRRVRTGAAQLS
jgi:transcriptional regulator with XRE-family HTH domain